MVRGTDPVLRFFDAKRFAIVEKRLYKFRSVITDTHAGGSGIRDDAIVHVRQVHYVVQLKTAQLQETPQNILEHECAVIPDVRVVVDRRPARVHAHFAGSLRNEIFDFPGQRVVQLNIGHGL